MKIVEKDLLTCFEDGIEAMGHNCNCQRSFGRGIALAIKNKFPAAYQADLNLALSSRDRFGGISVAKPEQGVIYNIYGQFDYRGRERNLDYEAIYTGLVAVRNDMTNRKLKSVAFPCLMGSDLAGGNWEIVSKMVEVVFKDTGISVTFYKL